MGDVIVTSKRTLKADADYKLLTMMDAEYPELKRLMNPAERLVAYRQMILESSNGAQIIEFQPGMIINKEV